MTEKRFTVPLNYSLSHSKIQCDGEPLTNDELVRILNTNDEAFLENFNLKKENKELKKVMNELKGDFRNFINEDIVRIKKENEKLKNEIKMLKSTIARNEAYITRLTKKESGRMTEKQCYSCKYYRKSDDYCYYRGYGSKNNCRRYERKWGIYE